MTKTTSEIYAGMLRIIIEMCAKYNSCPGYMDRLRKHYSYLVGGLFLAGKAAWALSGCLTTESADHCMLVNEWAQLRS